MTMACIDQSSLNPDFVSKETKKMINTTFNDIYFKE